ncbi:ABC transporter permease [Caloranaerobacter azorensis]|uniref:ABC transporter permease n=1 Tax=Caloranaerobacter azorensis TaxID=116090 RepID=A0A6P1YCT1_9FIRM|nr:ABC transporter permease [Caloranaerobacter azorensis]QIB27031.1 ABC transporter permease [Caloranaerobacter azorensis]
MLKFIAKRLAYGIVTLLIITIITFFLIHLVPGDPMSAGGKNLPEETKQIFREKYGLDKPIIVQYGIYMKNLILHGDLGTSIIYAGRSVNDIIVKYGPVSAVIGLQAAVIGITLGILLGIWAAFRRGSIVDRVIMIFVVLGVCIPGFVFAALLQYIFGVKLDILPIFGWGEAKHTVLPTVAMALGSIAAYCRYMRASTLDVISSDYVVTAEAKGVSTAGIILKHILRNSFIPIITLICPQLLFIFTGSFVIERIFAIPGLGAYFVTAVNDSDYSVILGLVIFSSALYIISLVVTDIFYGIVDPRIRLTKGER